MATVALYNMEGAKTGSMEVSDAIFAAEVNNSVLHQVVLKFEAAALSLGDRRVQAVQDREVSVLRSGLAAA